MDAKEGTELLLVDGSALLHRAYHAYPKLTTRDGRLVNAVYGVASMLISGLETIKPEYVAIAWDVPKPTFRHEKYVAYKAQRPKTEEALVNQIPAVRELIGEFGIVQIEQEGYEADDLIGTLAQREKGRVDVVVVLTGDQDVMQLVEDKVKILVPGRGQEDQRVFGEMEVVEKYGVQANRIVDYKALIGDSSDNIPGVVGIGPKTAVRLLQKFGSLEEIYHDLEEVGKVEGARVREMLEAGRESAIMSQDLSRIRCDVPIGVKLKDLEFNGLATSRTREALESLGFRSLVRRLFVDVDEKKDDKQLGMF